MKDRLQHAGLWVLVLSPVEWLLLAGSLALRARMYLGRWPRPYDPDPADISVWHHRMVQVGVPLMFSASVIAAAMIAISYWASRGQRRHLIGPLWVLGAGLPALLLLARIDPWGFFTWLGD